MHTPKGARRVDGCDSDTKSDHDNTVGGWMVVYGVASVSVLTYILRERERCTEPVPHAGQSQSQVSYVICATS